MLTTLQERYSTLSSKAEVGGNTSSTVFLTEYGSTKLSKLVQYNKISSEDGVLKSFKVVLVFTMKAGLDIFKGSMEKQILTKQLKSMKLLTPKSTRFSKTNPWFFKEICSFLNKVVMTLYWLASLQRKHGSFLFIMPLFDTRNTKQDNEHYMITSPVVKENSQHSFQIGK